MRTLIVCALLAFLAISFVQARPSEEESDVLDSTTENNVVEDSETTESEETEVEGEEEGDADENDDDEESTSTTTTTTEAPKHKKIFWPRFGGHGPVVIHRHLKTIV
ncbi:protein SHQ1 homolog [Drosophila tropicalis]|uniref:protein SHQ1 homolog n=1 Tax=Drosophila tropicalis TaxID=46794 RepID=UPI0035AB854F